MNPIKFGLRLPALSLDDSRRLVFLDQIVDTLEHFILRFADFPVTQVAETFSREVMTRF